jgi:hypothetical protein
MNRTSLSARLFLLFLSLLVSSSNGEAVNLKPKTNESFNQYVAVTEARQTAELHLGRPFLYIDALSDDAIKSSYAQLKNGEILVEKQETKAPGISSEIPDAMVHHWVGLIFIPGVTLNQVLPVVQDYDHRAELYKPDVIAAHLVSRKGNDYKIFMRLYQKRFTTVVFNTDYDIHWAQVDATRMISNSISTRVAEVKDPSHPDGEELAAGKDHGYLWRLNTYWRFEQKDGGVYLQCEALSLTRDIPYGLAWLIRPLVTAIPKQSLSRALGQTRQVVLDHVNHK